MNDEAKTIVLTEKKGANSNKNLIFETLDFSKNVPKQICEVLYKYEIQSVIVEGGAQTLQSFIDANLWDEVAIFIGDIVFKEGLKAPKLKKAPFKTRKILEDTLSIYLND
jgi:diaminohydroxyphosphoribosylaminopyrimidine deaminase/5-amino-6-(5-phosphoribosylamino)uracil reductase